MTGGRRVEIPLLKKGPIYLGERLPGELEASYDRYRKDEEGFKTFVDVNSLVQTETPPNYRITDLGWEYHTARDDVYGGGQDANKITSMDGNLSPIKSYGEVMNMVHFEGNKAQALEDSKVYGSTFNEVAGRADTEESDRRSYDTAYRAAFALVDKQLKASLDPVKLGKEEQQALTQEILSNPPVKSDIWQSKVDLYTEEFNKWAALPEPKEGWENYAIGMFVTWEVPLLEKERLLRAAKDKYELTTEEVDMIDSQYADAPTEELFDLILSDLYEVPTYDAEVEESIV